MGLLGIPGPFWLMMVTSTTPVLVALIISCSTKLDPIGFIGVLVTIHTLGLIAFKTLKGVYSTWIGVFLGHNVNLKKMGKWAVVTGATDGIGLAIAHQLAKLGLNVVLMSRSLERLESCASDIELKYKVKTKIVQVDFSQDVFAYEQTVDKELQGMEIGILINNVGMSYSSPDEFHSVATPDFINKMINLNVTAVTMMTRAVLLGMLDRNKGVVVNIGSYFGTYGGPYFSMYSSTKAFMKTFTLDLADEYKDKGIIFQYQCPGYVTTKMAKIRNPNFLTPTPNQYAVKALNSIGLQQNSAIWTLQRILYPLYQFGDVVMPDFAHKAQTFVLRTLWLFAKKRQMQKDLKYSQKL